MLRRISLAGAVVALAGSALLAGVPTADTGSAATLGNSGGDSGSAWTKTRSIGRVFTNADGSTYAFPERSVTVRVAQTHDLRGRQRIHISWSGAQPSGARASNPYGENGLLQEYPVVIMQCRGVDDPSLPAAKRLAPQTCWSSSVAERSQVQSSPSNAVWEHDVYAADADKGRLGGLDPFPGADVCPTADTTGYDTRLTPFRAANGKVYPACDAAHMPPEAAVGAAYPPSELAAFTDLDGNGSVQFEVRSSTENESLGCSHTVACSIVVIPIMGVSCDRPAAPPTIADNACRQSGNFPAGSSNFAGDGVDLAVSPALWWTESNWRNRFSVPITFGLPPDTCDILDPRAPTGFYGSELLAQAALQWAPAYCLRSDRFKFQANQMPDGSAYRLMEQGEAPAAEVSSLQPASGSDPVGYAPTAVTGFAVAYDIDRPDNAGEYGALRLNARLLAKLLTQSYLGSDLGRDHPGIGGNPLSINTDPEFRRLNPGLSTTAQEAAATVLSLSQSSDVLTTVTDYIAHDPAAMAFVSGKPDPWGMVVNPAYRNLDLPVAEWPLLDTFIPTTQNTCRQDNPTVYFSAIAAPVTTLRKVSEALLDAWPNVQTRCDVDLGTGAYKLGRIDRQSYGSRFMLGIVSLGDAARYGLRTAALQTKPGTYVGPGGSSLAAAIGLAHQAKRFEPFVIDQAAVRANGRAYPGTMVVYTAARLQHLDKDDAAKVAQFIRVSTTEGQRPGSGNGQLPAGYLPITDSGVTRKLFDSAQLVAAAVARQYVPPTSSPSGSPSPTPTDTSSTDPSGGPSGPPTGPTSGPSDLTDPGAGTPSTAPSPTTSPTDLASASAADVTPTSAVTSRVARLLLPVLLAIGIGCGLVAGLGGALTRSRQ